MLMNIKNKADEERHYYHQLNREKIHSICEADFNDLVRKDKNYDPVKFYEQWNRINKYFYMTNGYNSHLPIKRIFSDGSEDEYINGPEVHSTVHQWFGDALHPFIKEKVIYFIGTTAGEKYMPFSDEAFAYKEGTRFGNSFLIG